MKWFQYTQNNSGGSFVNDANVSNYVLIQAPNNTLADCIAESIGIYFNGVADGSDCDCCGDRWNTSRPAGDSEPLVYGKPPSNYGDELVRIYPFGSSNPVSIKDLENLPKPMVIEPS